MDSSCDEVTFTSGAVLASLTDKVPLVKDNVNDSVTRDEPFVGSVCVKLLYEDVVTTDVFVVDSFIGNVTFDAVDAIVVVM